MNAPSHDIQLRGLSDNSVAVDDSKASGMEGGEGNDTSLHEENPTDSEITKEYPTGLKFWLIILTMAALIILGGLDTNIVATAVPRCEVERRRFQYSIS